MSAVDEAVIALDDGRTEDALGLLAAYLPANPSDARAWKVQADACRRTADWAGALEALEQVRRATRGGSEAIIAWMLTAEVLDRHLGRPRRAREAWERVLQIDDTVAAAWLALAELHLRQHKWSAAIGNAQHGLQFAATTDEERGWLYLCIALGKRNVSASTGPTSSFFNRLGNPANGDRALVQAYTAWPCLIELLGHDPLARSQDVLETLRSALPWPTPPPWWAR